VRTQKPRNHARTGNSHGPAQGRPDRPREKTEAETGEVWLWGLHPVAAALKNPARMRHAIYATPNAAAKLGLEAAAYVEREPRDLDRLLPPGAVHQGVALKAEFLDAIDLADITEIESGIVAILDQVTDPHNVGAIFRSAAAFGVKAVIQQTRKSPPLNGVVAKASAGAIEMVAEVRVVNISRAIEAFQAAGWHVVGLADESDLSLGEAIARADGKLVIVLGAEGDGLRHGVSGACDSLARIAMPGQMESLNVSNAAAIAFYEATRR
jgi:23S rRNA (guanosine2251-2'-O)-methyltransferase